MARMSGNSVYCIIKLSFIILIVTVRMECFIIYEVFSSTENITSVDSNFILTSNFWVE